jgi:hypothetical protein
MNISERAGLIGRLDGEGACWEGGAGTEGEGMTGGERGGEEDEPGEARRKEGAREGAEDLMVGEEDAYAWGAAAGEENGAQA